MILLLINLVDIFLLPSYLSFSSIQNSCTPPLIACISDFFSHLTPSPKQYQVFRTLCSFRAEEQNGIIKESLGLKWNRLRFLSIYLIIWQRATNHLPMALRGLSLASSFPILRCRCSFILMTTTQIHTISTDFAPWASNPYI